MGFVRSALNLGVWRRYKSLVETEVAGAEQTKRPKAHVGIEI
jgi:hypothetical protein